MKSLLKPRSRNKKRINQKVVEILCDTGEQTSGTSTKVEDVIKAIARKALSSIKTEKIIIKFISKVMT